MAGAFQERPLARGQLCATSQQFGCEHAGADNDRPSAARLAGRSLGGDGREELCFFVVGQAVDHHVLIRREQPRGCEHTLAALLEGLAVKDGRCSWCIDMARKMVLRVAATMSWLCCAIRPLIRRPIPPELRLLGQQSSPNHLHAAGRQPPQAPGSTAPTARPLHPSTLLERRDRPRQSESSPVGGPECSPLWPETRSNRCRSGASNCARHAWHCLITAVSRSVHPSHDADRQFALLPLGCG